MKLEHTIQRSKISQSGIVGYTSKEAYVTQWKAVYRQVLNIINAYAKLTNIQSGHSEAELPLHHELSGNIHIQFNKAVAKVTTYISQRHNRYFFKKFIKAP